MTPIRLVTSALALAALTATAGAQHAQSEDLADPFHCVVVRDGQSNPVYTVCVPAV